MEWYVIKYVAGEWKERKCFLKLNFLSSWSNNLERFNRKTLLVSTIFLRIPMLTSYSSVVVFQVNCASVCCVTSESQMVQRMYKSLLKRFINFVSFNFVTNFYPLAHLIPGLSFRYQGRNFMKSCETGRPSAVL